MKKYSFLLAAALLVSCSDDLKEVCLLEENTDSRLVQLGENFLISGVGVENATRTHWTAQKQTEFMAVYSRNGAAGSYLYDVSNDTESVADLEYNKIGLCWVGQTAGDNKVYTNYEFYHFGWLNKGVDKADVLCGDLMNGSLYSDITLVASGTEGTEMVKENLNIPAKSTTNNIATTGGDETDNINWNSGVYKTENKAIFGGDYIVYYPYNKKFQDAGSIPAKASVVFPEVTDMTVSLLGDETFRYGYARDLVGGENAHGFGMKNLSGLVHLNVKTTNPNATEIDQVVLYSPNKKIVKEAKLDASKIIAGAEGQALYDGTPEYAKTIVINTSKWTDSDSNGKVDAGELSGINFDKDHNISLYFTALPTTIDELQVLVHSTTAGWAICPFDGSKEILPNWGNGITPATIDGTTVKFEKVFFATDLLSLVNAINEASKVPGATQVNPATVKIIGEIELTSADIVALAAEYSDLTPAFSATKVLTVPANVKIVNDKIVIKEDVQVEVTGGKIYSDIEIQGRSCCGLATNGGKLTVKTTDDSELANVSLIQLNERNSKGDAALAINAAMKFKSELGNTTPTLDVQAGSVDVTGKVLCYNDVNIGDSSTMTIYKEDDTHIGDFNVKNTQLVNDGVIEVKAHAGFAILGPNDSSNIRYGVNMTNNNLFIHDVDAVVGGATQGMQLKVDNGAIYRCRVSNQGHLDDAYLKWTACNEIEIVDASTYGFDLKNANNYSTHTTALPAGTAATPIDVIVSGETGRVAYAIWFISSSAGVNNIGNLTINNPKASLPYSLDIAMNYTGGAGNSSLKVNGNIVVANGAYLNYHKNNTALTVTGDIVLNGDGELDCDDFAFNVEATNLYLNGTSKVTIGNGKADKKNMQILGWIHAPQGTEFYIAPATVGLVGDVTCIDFDGPDSSYTNGKPRNTANGK